MLTLLTAPETDIATTLLVFPFAFPNFEDFYAFSRRLEDKILPKLERQVRPPGANTDAEGDIQVDPQHPSVLYYLALAI
jgi:hypothetical protein